MNEGDTLFATCGCCAAPHCYAWRRSLRYEGTSAEDALQQAIAGQQQARRALEILLGRYPADEIETATELVPVPPPIGTDIPSTLLERRPDVIAADRRIAAAFFLSEQALLAKLPRFSINVGVLVWGLPHGVLPPCHE